MIRKTKIDNKLADKHEKYKNRENKVVIIVKDKTQINK